MTAAAATISIRKGTFKHIESELFAYHDTKREIKQITADILHGSSSVDGNGGGRSNLPGDPTNRIVTSLITHKRLKQLEQISSAIEEVFIQLPEEKQKLIKLKYWAKPQTLTWDGIAATMNVGRRTALRWRDEIIYAIADTLGWR